MGSGEGQTLACNKDGSRDAPPTAAGITALRGDDRQRPDDADGHAGGEPEMLRIVDAGSSQIGRDLHDLLGSQLIGLSYLADSLGRRLKLDARPQADEAFLIRDEALLAHQQLRKIAHVLLPPVPTESLADGLARICEFARLWPGIDCRLENPDGALRVDPAATNHLLCIAREAVVNAVRHGMARTITIRLAHDARQGVLCIDDDGTRFSPDGIRGEGAGIRTMCYRAAAVGGALSIRAQPTGGVSVRCTFDSRRHVQQNADTNTAIPSSRVGDDRHHK